MSLLCAVGEVRGTHAYMHTLTYAHAHVHASVHVSMHVLGLCELFSNNLGNNRTCVE